MAFAGPLSTRTSPRCRKVFRSVAFSTASVAVAVQVLPEQVTLFVGAVEIASDACAADAVAAASTTGASARIMSMCQIGSVSRST